MHKIFSVFSGAFLYLGTLSLCAFTALGFWSDTHFLLDIISQFRAQYFWVGVGLLVWLVGSQRHVIWGLLALAALSVNAVVLAPYFLDEPVDYGRPVSLTSQTTKNKPLQVRAMQANVHSTNKDYFPFIEFVLKESPDIIAIQEFTMGWQNALAPLHGQYPHRVEVPRGDNFGIALFSKFPIDTSKVENWTDANLPSINATLSLGDRKVKVLATHPPPPIHARAYEYRNKQLDVLGQVANSSPAPVLVLGDLNTAPWSNNYAQLLHQTRLRDARLSFGLLPTWPAYFKPLFVPIDHVLVSEDFRVKQLIRGGNNASDHYPLIADLLLR